MYELPGCGRSDKPDAAYAAFFIEAIEEFFEERALRRCAVVGHS